MDFWRWEFPRPRLSASRQHPIIPKEIPLGTETDCWMHRVCIRGAKQGVEGMESNNSRAQKNRVRELRENRLMTQAQLARKAKVALRTIHSVEKGMNCRMDTKRKILLALGMRFEDKDYVFPPRDLFSTDPGMPSQH